ncbi:PAS domain-containing protein [Carboxylicivirga sp. N1Y90]|uniref:PAS domain-containing protein n=1 Tax=Carboxylicivirga fragile TaxID=3417571 RepID=UPI003D328283|nr:PAS domain-containing sensor histidine kinase [Marinilabiliaceae bacterium N1Y90]
MGKIDTESHLLLERLNKLEAENNALKLQLQLNTAGSMNSCSNKLSAFKVIADHIPGYVAYVNASDLNYQFVNAAFCEAFAHTRDEIIGKSIESIIGTENFQVALPFLNEVRSGKTVSFENIYDTYKGKRWIKVNYSPIFDANGKVETIIVLTYDINEKKKAEIKLKENEEKYRILIDDSSDPIFSFTPDGRYTYVNKVFADSVQKDQDYVIGNTIWDVFEKEEADTRFSVLSRAFDTGKVQVLEVRVPNPSGDLYFITTVTPIKNENGEIASAICIAKNITSRKRAELELQRSEKYLRIANATKDKFFSIIAHDLKNPFHSILGLSEVLEQQLNQNGDIDAAQYASVIHSSSQNAFKLLENLLEWSRVQTGNMDFSPEPFNLNALIEEVIALYKNAAQSKNITLNKQTDGSDELAADKNMCFTILRNLLSNAIKFTPSGGVVNIIAQELDDKHQISIADTGIGMEEEIRSNR